MGDEVTLRARGARRPHRRSLPGRAGQGRPLRELLPEALPSLGAARGLDPVHGPQAARARRRRARSGSRCSSRSGPRAAKLTVPGTGERRRRLAASGRGAHRRRRGHRLDRATIRLGARARGRRGAAVPPAARLDVPRAAAAHEAALAGARRALLRADLSVGAGARSRWTAGAAWRATTGAPSTRSAGSGCTASREDGDWLDAAIGRVKLGPAHDAVDRQRRAQHRGRPVRAPPREGDRGPRPLHVQAVGERRARCAGAVEAPRERFVGWVYADPDGSEHHAVNCSIADMRLSVSRGGGAASELVVAGRRRVRARDARARPRDRDPAVPGRVRASAEIVVERPRAAVWEWASDPQPLAASGRAA